VWRNKQTVEHTGTLNLTAGLLSKEEIAKMSDDDLKKLTMVRKAELAALEADDVRSEANLRVVISQQIRQADDELERRACERSLLAFTHAGWRWAGEPGRFVDNWHLECMCEHLEAVANSPGRPGRRDRQRQ
jgi:hypothetical protein